MGLVGAALAGAEEVAVEWSGAVIDRVPVVVPAVGSVFTPNKKRLKFLKPGVNRNGLM